MKVAYAPRAVADLSEIGVQSRKTFGNAVTAALETYIRATVARIAVMPESGQRLPERPAVRVVPLVRYPFKIFYTAAGETLTILHIRHAARRPWGE
jgi:toxin ParE1/3/4